LPLISLYHDSSDGYIIKSSELERFIDSVLKDKLLLNEKEITDLRIELEREARKVHSDDLHLSFIERELIDKYLPISITPTPNNIERVFIYMRRAQDNEQATAPCLKPLTRSPYTVVETGVLR